MTDQRDEPIVPLSSERSPTPPSARRNVAMAAAFAAGLVLGGGALVAVAHQRETLPAAPLTPAPIASLQVSPATAAKGEVAEIFGNKFILQDATGRTLVDTGPEGEGAALVNKGETLGVEGSFEDATIHAAVLTHADGRRVVLGPIGGPPRPMQRLRDRLGIWPEADMPALTTLVQSAGYDEVRVTGRGPHHVDVVAKSKDGKEHALHVDLDGRIEERPML